MKGNLEAQNNSDELLLLQLLSCFSCVRLCATHRQQPTRLLCPWDSPGKNTGVGCHFLLQCMKVKSESEVTQLCPTPRTPWTGANQAPPSMGFSRQEHWSGCHCLVDSVSLRMLALSQVVRGFCIIFLMFPPSILVIFEKIF